MTPHVAVAPHLRLEPWFCHVEGLLQRHDPQLRLRKSAERPRFYVLERRARRAPAVNAGLSNATDLHIQARDGYIHVSLVHWQWLVFSQNIVHALLTEGEDLFAKGGHQVADEAEYEERWAAESRKRRRFGLLRDIAGDGYETLNRTGNKDGTERTRISNVGTVSQLVTA